MAVMLCAANLGVTKFGNRKAYQKKKEVYVMKASQYNNYEELPLFLNAEMMAKLLGISVSSAYELMHEENFPALRIGNRIVVPKEKFRQWVEQQTGGGI